MNLTKKQLKIFNRLHKKFPVSLEFLDCNIERILKFINYAISLHFVYKCQLVQRKHRSVIHYNVPKRNMIHFRTNPNNKRNQNKKFYNKIKKLQVLPWSQRVLFYLKKQRLLEKINETSVSVENNRKVNFDLQIQRSILDLNEDSSNSQSVIDKSNRPITSEKVQLSSNDVDLKIKKCKEIFKIEDKNLMDKKIFCEKTGIFKKRSELISRNRELIRKELQSVGETLDTISNSDSEQQISEIGENHLSPEQVEQLLKTQLELLKCGKRSKSLLSENTPNEEKCKRISNEKPESNLKLSVLLNNKRLSSENCKFNLSSEELSEDTADTDIVILKPSEIDNRLSDEINESETENCEINKLTMSSCSAECLTIDSFEISEKDALEAGPSTKVPSIFQKINNKFVNELNIFGSELTINSSMKTNSQKKNTSIVDSLMTKLSNNLETKTIKECIANTDKLVEASKQFKTIEEINNSMESYPKETTNPSIINDDNSSSSEDFYGFNSDEIIPPNIPGMLATPAVPTFSSISAFICKDDKPSNVQILRRKTLPMQYEDGIVRLGRPPPKFEMAALPEEMSKPRTLAEKRMILSKQRSFKYFMIENENTVYHELKRRTRDGRINTSFIKSVQRCKVPASRDLWKATCWLLTENEKFYFQTVQIDGQQNKILSGLGNFHKKQLPSQYSSPLKKELKPLTDKKCSINCLDRKVWQTIRIRFKNPTMKMHTQMKDLKIFKEENRPGPLSFKKKLFKQLYGNFNPLEIYKMPKIELEVYPRLNQPLDEYIKSYLKMILPSESITKEWAEFAVSTLVEKANQNNNEIPNVCKNRNNILQTKNSFKFTIPYLNDQTHILVRRVLTRCENFDNNENLKFRDFLKNSEDKITLECADVLCDMIDSVAIGLSENSFIHNDPDIDYNKQGPINKTQIENIDTVVQDTILKRQVTDLNEEQQQEKTKINTEFDKKNNKKGRNPKAKLMAELKRLNATIINASDAKIAKPKVCEKEYCRLGCICTNLGSNYIPKKHCKKVKCMLEKCNCPLTVIEAGNSIITSEDAFIFRRKATARLARMEREFTSTVVLNGNETLLINENQTKRKRRYNARLSNYYIKGVDDDESKTFHGGRSKNTTPNNLNTTPTLDYLSQDEEVIKSQSPVKEARLPIDIDSIFYIDEDIMKSLKHCTVDLYPLHNFEDNVVWCMVHCLYKCFCNGRDTEGKPFILKKQEEEKIGEMYTRKAKYSFDKSEDESSIIEPPRKQLKVETKLDKNKKHLEKKSMISPLLNNEPISNTVETMKPQQNIPDLVTPEEKHRESRIICAYINNDFYGSHRVQPVPKVYKIRNKRQKIKDNWRKFPENEMTLFILNERIRSSENYVRKVIVKRPPGQLETNNNYNNCNNSDNFNQIIVPSKNTISKTEMEKSLISKLEVMNKLHAIPKQVSLIKPEVREKLKLSTSNENIKQQTQSPILDQSPPKMSQSKNGSSPSSSFKISSVMSLNDDKSTTSLNNSQVENETKVTITEKNKSPSQEPSNNEKFPLVSSLQLHSTYIKGSNSEQFTSVAEQVQKEVMRRLNYSVTKTMHNITKIQLEENANIPNPQVDMMIAVQWKHFLQYFVEDKIYIWQVKIDKATYYVGTMKYKMPYVINAMAVVNIKAMRKENLPLFAQMLNAKMVSTSSLSILMAGYRDYWRILGMTKSNKVTRVGVIRPTTESHPNLTPKINKLFNILTQQYIENMKSRPTVAQQLTPTSIVSLQHANKKIKLDSTGSPINPQIYPLEKPIVKTNQTTPLPTMVVINNKNFSGNDIHIRNKGLGSCEISPNNIARHDNKNLKRSLKMNIKIRKLTKEEAMTENFQVPLTTSNLGNHRWLVLDLEDDFSHIVFGNSMESLTHSKIKLALKRSQTENKMVRFPQVDGGSVDCYIMKFDKKRIYLGPFHETIDPVIILYQNVNGKMILREDNERLRCIKREKYTTGFWLCRKNGKIMFDMDPSSQDLSTISLQQHQQIQQQNNKNLMHLLQQQNLKLLQPMPNDANPNSIIKLIPENKTLLQSQCNNLLLSDLNVNNDNSKLAVCSKDSSNLQQVINQVNKIVTKPCIITSIKENSSVNKSNMDNLKKMSDTPALKTNILESPVIISGTIDVDELPMKKFCFSKNQNDIVFSSNVLPKPISTVSNAVCNPVATVQNAVCNTVVLVPNLASNPVSTVPTSVCNSVPTTSTAVYNSITTIPKTVCNTVPTVQNAVCNPVITESVSKMSNTNPLPISTTSKHINPFSVKSFGLDQNPMLFRKILPKILPNNISVPRKKLASHSQFEPKIHVSSKTNSMLNPKNLVRPLDISDLRAMSKESVGKLDTKVIGKYNQVIISKTTEQNFNEALTKNEAISKVVPPINNNSITSSATTALKSKLNEKNIATAEIEEHNGQLILKLPEKFQHKILSQQFTVSKNESGAFILEPSNITTSKTISPAPKTNLNSEHIVQKSPQATTSILNSISSTSSTYVTNASTVSKSTENPPKKINSSLKDILFATRTSGVVILKNKPQFGENNSKSMLTKLRKPNEIQLSRKINSKDSTNGMEGVKPSFKPTLVPKITQIPTPTTITTTVSQIVPENKVLNSNKTSESKNQKQEEQLKFLTSNKNISETITVIKTSETITISNTTMTRSKSNLSPRTTIDKPALNASTCRNISSESEKKLSKSKSIGILFSKNNVKEPSKTPQSNTANVPITEITPKTSTVAIANIQNSPITIKDSNVTETSSASATIEQFNLKGKDLQKTYTAKNLLFSPSGISKLSKESLDVQKFIKVSPSMNKESLNSVKNKNSFSDERLISFVGDSNKGLISGYFIAQNKNYPKFGGFRKGNEYLIKTNLKSALQLPSINEVSKHLNGFVKKQCPTYKSDVKWEFVSFKTHTRTSLNESKLKISPENLSPKIAKIQNKNDSSQKTELIDLEIDKKIKTKNIIVIDDDDDEDNNGDKK